MGRRITVLIIGILAVTAGAGIYYFYFAHVPTVKVAAAVVGSVSETVFGSGTVEPVQWAKVVPLERRRLVQLCRCEGLSVKKDQVLGQQDDAEERSQLDELNVRHDQLVRDLQRAEDDHKHNKISDAEYEQRQTAVNESQSRIASQKVRLGALVLRSPLDGMVLRRDSEVGEIVGPTEVLFWVGNPSPLQVVAEINEEEITKIAVGQVSYLSNEAFAGQALRATVSQITPKGDPTKQTFRVYLLLPEDTPLRIGMTVEINIVFREKKNAILVPNEAVVNNTVEIVEDGRVRRVPVSVGVHGSRTVEVSGDLAPGMFVVTPAQMDLKTGGRVHTDTPTVVAAETPKSNVTPAAAPSGGRLDLASGVDMTISSALTAHMQSIVNDARKDAAAN